jgi:F-type H+-transporting ATPase subunit epsilon
MTATQNQLLFNLRTPSFTFLRNFQTTMAVLPGSEGDLGIMAHHTPLMTTLASGDIRLFEGEKIVFNFYFYETQHGVLNVNEDSVDLFIEEFCLICNSPKMHGFKPFSSIRIECKKCGSYRVDPDAFVLMQHHHYPQIKEYISQHRNAIITAGLLENLA